MHDVVDVDIVVIMPSPELWDWPTTLALIKAKAHVLVILGVHVYATVK